MFKLNKFMDNVADSLQALQTTISQLNSGMSAGASEKANLKMEIDTLNNQLNAAIIEKDSFSFLGSNIGKGSFKTVFWVITGILAALLALVSIRFKTKVAQTKEAKSNFLSLESEFDDFKKRSREKEQVLARQLQDEINKSL